MATTGYTKAGADSVFGRGPSLGAFTWDGSTAVARLTNGTGTINATGANAASALNSLITAVNANTTGGTISVYSSAGAIPITAPIVMASNVCLLGTGAFYNQTSSGAVMGNSVLKASGAGMTTSNAIIQSTGTSGTFTSQGIQIQGIGLDGNNQTMCWDTINCNAPVVANCVVAHGKPWGTRFRSDIAPNPLPGGGFAAQVWDTQFHGMSSGTGGQGMLQSTGTGATDGRVVNCLFRLGSITTAGCNMGGGGWIIEGSRMYGDPTATQYLVNLTGANSSVVGNQLIDAEQGNCVIVAGPKMVVNSNYMYNATSTGATACILVSAGKGAITGNTLDTGGTGHGMHLSSGTGAPTNYGVIAHNHTIGVKAFSDSAGTEVPDLDGSGTYIGGNTLTAT